MPQWTPDRYRELARLCRDNAGKAPSPQQDFLDAVADEYEAKAASGGSHC
jgi:hypothetical protein